MDRSIPVTSRRLKCARTRSAPARSNSSSSSRTNTSRWNPDYWKPGRPYLDAIEWTIIPNRSTQSLAFIAGQFDVTFPYEVTIQMVHDINSQAPNAICEIDPTPVAFNLLVNRDNPPFNDPDIRRAMQLTIDRKTFLDIISEGQGDINGAMQSPPARS